MSLCSGGESYQDSVKSRGCATSLHVSKNCDASVKAELVSNQLDKSKTRKAFTVCHYLKKHGICIENDGEVNSNGQHAF